MPLRYAYNTNGCAHHRLPDALDLIAEAGYAGVGLTLDWQHLDVTADDYAEQARRLDRMLRDRELGLVDRDRCPLPPRSPAASTSRR